MKNKIIINFSFLLFIAIQTAQNLHAADDVPNDSETDIIVSKFVSGLKGIELYYMIETIGDKALSLQKMNALLKYRQEKIPEQISTVLANPQTRKYNFAISKINRKAGFMSLYGIGFEVSVSKTYWNIDRKRKLVATLVSTCTMVCEDNDLYFTLIKNNSVADKNYHVEIPELLYKPEYFLKDRNNTTAFNRDAVGVMVALPEKGMNILFKLDGDVRSDDRDIFRGNCVKLAWDKKKANFNVMPPEFCKRQ